MDFIAKKMFDSQVDGFKKSVGLGDDDDKKKDEDDPEARKEKLKGQAAEKREAVHPTQLSRFSLN